PVGWATGWKLAALEGNPKLCFSTLDTAGVEYERLPDGKAGDPCAFKDVLFLKQSVTAYSAPLRLSCPLAASLNLWERKVLQPAAEAAFGVEVERIDTFGTYSCRRINGSASGRWSEHATANAIDIAGFRLSDGRRVSVLKNWAGSTEKGDFLRHVFKRGCKVFDTALGPEYNAAHADHFHFDRGRWQLCR
ncbi:MAG: extensin family protein, partial [Pseudomonadota bacterium]